MKTAPSPLPTQRDSEREPQSERKCCVHCSTRGQCRGRGGGGWSSPSGPSLPPFSSFLPSGSPEQQICFQGTRVPWRVYRPRVYSLVIQAPGTEAPLQRPLPFPPHLSATAQGLLPRGHQWTTYGCPSPRALASPEVTCSLCGTPC